MGPNSITGVLIRKGKCGHRHPGRIPCDDMDAEGRCPCGDRATDSSTLAWRIPGMGESGGLPSMGSHGVRHN